jgi:hypothetical protein
VRFYPESQTDGQTAAYESEKIIMNTIKMSCAISAGLLCSVLAFNSHANNAVGQGMLTLLDFDRTHAAVVSECKKRAPDTVASLEQAFAAWKAAHESAQKQLQTLAAQEAHQPGKPAMSDAEFGVIVEMLRNASLSKLSGQLAAKDSEAIARFCKTEYPQGLVAPEMNFTNRLLELQARQ